MSYLRYVVRRAVVAVISVYLVVTVTMVATYPMMRNWIRGQLALAQYSGASQAALARMREGLEATYGLNQPFHERLLEWWVNLPTLDWGQSVVYEAPVVSILDGRVQTTLAYVVPGVVLALLLGVLFGLFAALSKNGVFDWSVRLGSYVLFGIPVFVLLAYMVYFAGWEILLPGGWVLVLPDPNDMTIAALAVAAGLLAGQVRFARASALEQTGQSFVKMLRAKGATRLRLARHVLRNAAIPIVSLSITELLAVLVFNIYVIEEVLDIQGLAEVTLVAARRGDLPLLVWSTMVVVFVGITAGFLQDVLYGYLDPRVRSG